MNEIDKASIAHYEKTIAWCEETGFPKYWIAKPDAMRELEPLQHSTRPEGKRAPADGTHRNHRQGHGWKANHQS